MSVSYLVLLIFLIGCLGMSGDVWGRSFDTAQWKYDRIPWEAIRYHKGKEKGRSF